MLVFDVLGELREERAAAHRPLYLTTDTHWRPETVELVAERLATFVEQHVALPSRPPIEYQATRIGVTNTGDTTRLLDLPDRRSIYRPETASIRRITRGGNADPWRADPDANILLLGDSFSTVFSLGVMGWGDSAGLAEQLSFALQRPIDRLSQNDNGAYASRELLATELRRGRDRLAGKRVVVYQFASRELGQGDWRFVDLSVTPRPSLASFVSPEPGQRLVVQGTVREIGRIPRPGSVPYRDHIVGVHVAELTIESFETPVDGSELLVYVWSMQDDELTPISRYRTGDAMRLEIEPWTNVGDELDGINRGDVDSPAARLAEPWWGRLIETPR